ncbi:alkaline phosphatase family protein [soil metagenome]
MPPALDAGGSAKKNDVLVTIVVDQLAAWMADERLAELPKTGGFARLLREGTYVRELRYRHSTTETAPGHSALYTGATPRVSGIFGNEIIDPITHKRVTVLRDRSATQLLPIGTTEDFGSSLAILDVETLADRLRAEREDADIVAISLKDRGALFGGGRKPDASIFFDTKKNSFCSSSALMREYPAWAKIDVEAMEREPWKLLDQPRVEKHSVTPDAQNGEGDIDGFGITFPHDYTKAKTVGYAFRASPRGDEAILTLARAAVDRHDAARPLLLALSLSSHDGVNHYFGPDSWEAWDELLRLDGALGAFFTYLDGKFGEAGWSAMLTADHGGVPMPEVPAAKHAWCNKNGGADDRWQRPCIPGVRILQDELGDKAEAEAQKIMGTKSPATRWLDGFASPYVFLSFAAINLPKDKKDKLVAGLRKMLLAYPGIDRVVYDRDELKCDTTTDAIDKLVCDSLGTKTPPAFYLVGKKGAFFDPAYAVGKGTSHGAPYLYDRAVPLLIRSPGKAAAGSVVDTPTDFTEVVRTSAAILKVRAPSGAMAAPP